MNSDHSPHPWRRFKAAWQAVGMTDQQVKLYLPLNAPGESPETLRATMARIDELYALFGRDKVLPFIFFVGVQPNTPNTRASSTTPRANTSAARRSPSSTAN